MAKKDDKNNGALERESGGSKIVTMLIVLVIVLIWLIVFGCLIKWDVGGIGSNILYPVLKDVPVVNRILPQPSEEEQAAAGNYKYTTLEAANKRIDELENQLASSDSTSSANSDYITQLENKVKELKKYQNNEDELAKREKEFDQKVVFTDNAPDISEYKKYYEQIAPENAKKLYKQVVVSLESSQRAKELAAMYGAMDPASAAKPLTQMSENLDLVCDILRNMSSSKAGAILQAMDENYAAQITAKISEAKKTK